jgi:protein-disulfide isomerase
VSRRPSGVLQTRAERRRVERAERTRARPRARAASRPAVLRSPVVLVTGLAVAAAIFGIIVLNQANRPSPASDAGALVVPTSSYRADLADGETVGRADAPVALEIWSDFQCPFCGQLARDYLPRLVSDFVASGQVRIVPHDVDFLGRGNRNESVEAAVAASCAADQGKYWQFHDFLFWNQNGENTGAFSVTRLEAMADRVGLDRPSWNSCRIDPKRAQAVASTTSQALSSGINSTPTLALNGTATAGLPRTYDDLASAIRGMLPGKGLSGSPVASASIAP